MARQDSRTEEVRAAGARVAPPAAASGDGRPPPPRAAAAAAGTNSANDDGMGGDGCVGATPRCARTPWVAVAPDTQNLGEELGQVCVRSMATCCAETRRWRLIQPTD